MEWVCETILDYNITELLMKNKKPEILKEEKFLNEMNELIYV